MVRCHQVQEWIQCSITQEWCHHQFRAFPTIPIQILRCHYHLHHQVRQMVDHQQVALEDQEKWTTLKQGLRPYKEACDLQIRKT